MLGSSFSAVTKRIRAMNFVNKLAVGVPYYLTPQNTQGCIEGRKTPSGGGVKRSFVHALMDVFSEPEQAEQVWAMRGPT